MSENPNTIAQPTADELRKNWQNRRARGSKTVDIATDQKYAVVLLLLNPAVSQPGDYATLGANIKAITGIQDVKLMVDGHTVSSVPTEDKLVAMVNTAIRQVTIPQPQE